jgi:hypothetical protein
VDLAQGLRRHEVPVDEHPIEPRSPAVAHERGGRRRGRCHHHHGSDVPLVTLQLRHLQRHRRRQYSNGQINHHRFVEWGLRRPGAGLTSIAVEVLKTETTRPEHMRRRRPSAEKTGGAET